MLATIALLALCQCPNGQCAAPRQVVLYEPTYRVGAPARPAVYATPSSPAPAQFRPFGNPETSVVHHASLLRAAGFPAKQWVWLTKQGVWGYGFRRADGLWVIDPGSRRRPAPSPTPAPAPVTQADPYGFTAWLNTLRGSMGLRPLAYDPTLTSWAAANNAQQASRGLGHWVVGPGSSCAAMAPGGIVQAEGGWMQSPPHRAILLSPSASSVGIAGLGQWWTCDTR